MSYCIVVRDRAYGRTVPWRALLVRTVARRTGSTTEITLSAAVATVASTAIAAAAASIAATASTVSSATATTASTATAVPATHWWLWLACELYFDLLAANLMTVEEIWRRPCCTGVFIGQYCITLDQSAVIRVNLDLVWPLVLVPTLLLLFRDDTERSEQLL